MAHLTLLFPQIPCLADIHTVAAGQGLKYHPRMIPHADKLETSFAMTAYALSSCAYKGNKQSIAGISELSIAGREEMLTCLLNCFKGPDITASGTSLRTEAVKSLQR
jgi:hypothetical protein